MRWIDGSDGERRPTLRAPADCRIPGPEKPKLLNTQVAGSGTEDPTPPDFAKLVNETLIAAPGPPSWVAASVIVAGVILKKPRLSVTSPFNFTVISSVVPRLIDTTSVNFSVNTSPSDPVQDFVMGPFRIVPPPIPVP